MAHLNYSLHGLKCLPIASEYFPSGIREIVRFKFIDDNGDELMSEWAPLAGIHQVLIDEAILQAKALSSDEIKKLFALVKENNNEILGSFFSRSFPYPLSFIASMAVFYGQIKKTHFSIRNKVALSTLIFYDHSLKDIFAFLDRGIKALKIKVRDVHRDSERINAIQEAIPAGIKIRLDANRRLSISETKLLLSTLSEIHYIEEPSFELTRLSELQCASPVGVALDESFDGKNWSIFEKTKAQFLVLKPSRFNNLFSVMNLIKMAKELSIKVILSPCFESDFYASLIEKLAIITEIDDEPHGIYAHIFSEESFL